MWALWAWVTWAAPTGGSTESRGIPVQATVAIPKLTPTETSRAIAETLNDEGIEELATGELWAEVRSAIWRYEHGLLQAEVVLSWSVRRDPGAEQVYEAQTRGLATLVAPRPALARRHRRRGTLAALPSAHRMRLEAVRSATRSLATRDHFLAVAAPGGAPSKIIDHADRSELGTAPAALQEPVARSGVRIRNAGIVVALAGALVSITARGRYLVSQEDPIRRRGQVRAVEVSGFCLMAGGGALWLHGDQRSRAWRQARR
ncbi:MAG: hypothetical protein KTR31_22255 [Myxococcales bacterium]|nr:hypothetical protein [Myxococcales bacterium]